MIPQGVSFALSTRASSVLRPIAGSPLQPRLPARLLARVRSFSLDGKLIGGADPASSTLLAARAAKLTSKSSRDSLAGTLETLLASAEGPAPRTRVRPRPVAVLANESTMRRLAERLRSVEPLYARGMAHLSALLGNANSPAFRGDAATLAAELEAAAAELGGHREPQAASDRRGSADAGTRPIRRDPAGFVGGSFLLPNGSWYHTRREGS
jgi:hypothetical protein